jgi:hypothetical protein
LATTNSDFRIKNGLVTGSTIVAPAATTAIPSLRLPHGSAPTTPTDGDFWTTTAGVYARVNGATVGPFGSSSGGVTYTFSTTPPGSPSAGAEWVDSNTLILYTFVVDTGGGAGQWVSLASLGNIAISSGAAVGSATPLALGTATVGTSVSASHEDHIHPTTGLATSGANSNITSLTGLTTALTVAQGGTGSTTSTGTAASAVVLQTSPTITTPIIDIINAASSTSTTASLFGNILGGGTISIGTGVSAGGTKTLNIGTGGGTGNTTVINLGSNNSIGTSAITFHGGTIAIAANSSHIPFIIRGAASQASDLTQWQNSTPSVLAKIDLSGNMTAASFIKTGGTSSQFLKADGSSDSTVYAGANAASYAAMRGFTSTVTSASTVTLTNTSTPYQLFTGTLAQAVSLPAVGTLALGWTFHIDNDSTNTITVSGGAGGGGGTVITIPPLFAARIICISITVDAVASWDAIYSEFHTYTGSGNMVFGTSPTITALTHAAGTATAGTAPEYFTSGTLLTAAAAGAVEYDGTSFYMTPASVIRSAIPASYVSRKAATITIATATGGQSLLASSTAASASTGIALAAATTYEFEIRFSLTTTGTTSHTEAIGFYYSGTTSFYNITAERTIANVAATAVRYAQIASGTTLTSNIISVVMTPAITTAQTNAIYEIRGWVTTNTAGNWTPTIAFSAAPGATSTVAIGATVKLTPYQSASGVVNISTWA